MSRQHASKARGRTPRSSVWIDPAVSTYLQGEHPSPVTPSRKGPATPIPPRASAQHRAVQVRPRYPYTRAEVNAEDDPANIPTQPPPATWQYESQDYSAESSLSSLSLIVDTPTNPQGILASPASTDTPAHGIPRIDEMDTRPPAIVKSTIQGIVDSTIDATPTAHSSQQVIEQSPAIPVQLSPTRPTWPPETQNAQALAVTSLPGAASLFLTSTGTVNDAPTLALTPVVQAVPAIPPLQSLSPVVLAQDSQLASAEPASWTAGEAAGSRYARLVASRTNRRKASTSFNLLDRLRWWLLHPGRFEFLLWLGGTILLVTVTCILLLMMAFSVQWNVALMNNGASSSFKNTINQSGSLSSTPGVSLVVTHAGTLLAGQSLHLSGSGFSANGHIALTYDANRPFLLNGQPVQAQADAHGTFALTLTCPSSWAVGQHHILARDLASGHLAIATVTVLPASTSATATPVVTAPAASPTAIQQGNNTPPVGQTPTVVSTTGITPTPTPRPPTPSPTAGITPTATVGTTPTPGVTPTPRLGQSPTPGVSATPNLSETPTVNSGSSNPAVLNTQYIAGSGGSAITATPWLWLLIGGYLFAMLLFGVAGLLHKHKKVE